MLLSSADLHDADLEAAARVEALWAELALSAEPARRWSPTLSRATRARAVQASTSIAGYEADVGDVTALLLGEPVSEVPDHTARAVTGYAEAAAFARQMAGADVAVDPSMLRSLHFLVTRGERGADPGLWRTGGLGVEDTHGRASIEDPGGSGIDALVADLVAQLSDPDMPAVVAAAMAHLTVATGEPFAQGNLRVARVLHTLVAASSWASAGEFASVEEYLGRDPQGYRAALAAGGRGRRGPEVSPRPWVEYCLVAHFRQAQVVRRRIRETEALWDACGQLVGARRLPERGIGALVDAAGGLRLHRSLYKVVTRDSIGEVVTDATATRDLVALADGGLLSAVGERRGRTYRASDDLRAAWEAIRSRRLPATGDDSPYG